MNWSYLKFWEAKKHAASLDDKAVKKFMENIRTRPGNPDSHYLLANFYQERGRYREAIIEYDKVLAIDPRNIKAYNGRGIALDQIGEHLGAQESFEKAIALDDKADYIWNNLCYSLIMQKKYDEAIASCKKALTLNEKNSRMRNNLALAYAMAGLYEEAFKEFVAASNGNKAHAHLKLAEIYFDKAVFEKSLEHYKAALSLEPGSTKAAKGIESAKQLIKIAEAANQIDVEEKVFAEEHNKRMLLINVDKKTITTVDTAKAKEQTDIAQKLYEKGSFDKAKEHFVQAIAFNPTLTPAYKGLAASEALAKIDQAPSIKNTAPVRMAGNKNINNLINRVGIEISNGNGKRYMARDIGKYLKKRGFNVVRLTNADNFKHNTGRIYYEKEYRDVAVQISSRIPEITELKEIPQFTRQRVKVKLLIGQDLIAAQKAYLN
jgi:tetratricopeptide (TPR) repeat protein